LKINFLRPVYDASLAASGIVIQRDRDFGLAECSVTDQTGRLVAKATSTFITVRGGRVQNE
jgi:acyl-coenzyme A thioesterase PaaI-like protein